MSVAFDVSFSQFHLCIGFTVSPVRIHAPELRMNMGSGRHSMVMQVKFLVSFISIESYQRHGIHFALF